MSGGQLVIRPFGPFVKGVVDRANASLGESLSGACRRATGMQMTGVGALTTWGGTEVALTLMDDAGTPAACSAVSALVPFGDGALAVAFSSATGKVYAYRFDALLSGSYNAAGTFTAGSTAAPCGTLWTGATVAPVVTIAEAYGTATIAHADALNGTALAWPTKTVAIDATTGAATLATLTADLDTSGAAEDCYFAGIVMHAQHLFAWAFDGGTVAATAYRPEILRHSAPFAGTFAPKDGGGLDTGAGGFTVGTRIRSTRERILAAVSAGDALYVATAASLVAITGYGRDTFAKIVVSETLGAAGVQAMTAANGVPYLWTARGPARVTGGQLEPLWDAVAETVDAVTTPSRIVAGYDVDRDQVQFALVTAETNGEAALLCAFDVRRDVWLGPQSARGVGVRAIATIAPVTSATVTLPGPLGPPTSASTTDVGQTVAHANWTAGDLSAGTSSVVEVRRQSGGAWSPVATVPAATVVQTLSGLLPATAYEWRVRHEKNATPSTELGPSVNTQFTTTARAADLSPPTALAAEIIFLTSAHVSWTNSGEAGAETSVEQAGPSVGAPASGAYTEIIRAAEGVASTDTSTGATGRFWYRVRHVRSGAMPSSYAGPVSVDL